jgi:hypothetical protein
VSINFGRKFVLTTSPITAIITCDNLIPSSATFKFKVNFVITEFVVLVFALELVQYYRVYSEMCYQTEDNNERQAMQTKQRTNTEQS